MAAKVNLQVESEQVRKDTGIFATAIQGVSTFMSGVGIHAFLPGDDWMHYTQVGALTLGTYAVLKMNWTYQRRLFVQLASDKLNPPAILSHIGAIAITGCLSIPTTYVGMASEVTSEYDMESAYTFTVEKATDAKRNFHSASSIVGFIDSQAEKMADLASDARLGKLSGTAGEGSVYRTYAQTRDSLKRLSVQINDNESEFESSVSRLNITQGKMRKALESDLPLPEKVTAFETAYRQQADIYTALMERDLSRQIEASLNSFLANALAPDRGQDNVREALQLAQDQARDTVREINNYVQANAVTLRPMPPYRLASPAIVSFRYVKEFWVQFALACALDLSILVAVWMQILALRKAQEGTPENFTKT